MKSFQEFLDEEAGSGTSGLVKSIRKVAGPGKTNIERGTHTLHLTNKEPDHISGVVKHLDSKLGSHSVENGKKKWAGQGHTVHMTTHADGHHMLDVQPQR